MSENTVDSTITDLPNEILAIADDDFFVADDTSELDLNKRTKKVSGLTIKQDGFWTISFCYSSVIVTSKCDS